MSRRAAHWVQTVSVPAGQHGVAQFGQRRRVRQLERLGPAGHGHQAASPVNQSDTAAPAAAAVAATVNACAQRSAPRRRRCT